MAWPDVGSVFAGHRIDRLVGRGGMGVVYRATDLTLERDVALKLIAPELAGDIAFRERFKRESRLAASIRHPHVVTIFRADEEDRQLFIAMEYVDGSDLRALIHRQGRLEPPTATRIIEQVTSALDAAHARGLVHRDVKPGNVLLEGEGSSVHAYLTDFGLTKRLSSESGITATGVLVGTIDYIAPEQVEGRPLDARTDVYALGCVLFHALTGRVPYPRDTDMAKLYAHTMAAPPSLLELVPDLPPALDRVVRRAMAKKPAERFRTAQELGQALLATSAQPPHSITRPAPSADTVPAAEPAPTEPAAPPTGAQSAPPAAPAQPPPTTAKPSAGDQAPSLGAKELDAQLDSESPLPTSTDTASDSKVAAKAPVHGRAASRPQDSPQSPDAPPTSTPAKLGLRTRARRGLALVLAAGLVLGLVVVVLALTRDDPTGAPSSPDRPPPSIPVGSSPHDVAVGYGAVWVANWYDGTVSRIDPERNRVVGKPIPVGNDLQSLAVGEGAVWVANSGDGTVSRIDPARNRVVGEPIPVADDPYGVAVGEGAVWVANFPDETVSRIDPQRNRVAGQPIPVGGRPV